ncbi:spore germination protein [Clostridium sp. YIM B02515]|uniref:Spore germination protein n=1 Tax=Clostridium rhizosphaerae TaxID=2803861 RepID=A0ABS1TGZ5_9CLOT|nr:spore germination protein [Clostridium rhizosphaerae]MBL4938641.1 spore germination protein [Clostridium rhizosphaerae]
MIRKDKYANKIRELINNISDVSVRSLYVKNKSIYILYIPQITNKERLSEEIIKPIIQYSGNHDITEDLIMKSVIYLDEVFCANDENEISNYILDGKSIIIISDCEKYLVANTLKVEKRSVESPAVQSSARSPKDAFVEAIDVNISLIRYRIRNSALKIDYYSVGKRTKTSVAVIYIEDIANPTYVAEIKNRIQKINVDGILESGYVQKFISDGSNNLFPQTGICERSDEACADILDGKVCILVNGSNLALIAPKTFIEFFDAGDDHYENVYFGIFLKFIRFLSLIISLTLSSIYVAVVGFHSDFLPSQYILAIAASRVGVPVNSALEATIMEIILELLREANLRLPKKIGTSIGIVGAIVIGQALVAAGLVSSPIIIIVALSSLASYAVPDFTIITPIRILKFLMIFLTAVFGLFGFAMGLSIIMIKLASTTSFDVPYTSPVSPFSFKAMKNFIFSNVTQSKERPEYLDLKDKTRE